MKYKIGFSIFFFVIISLAIFFNKDSINNYPSNTHAWAQADRYALALGFLENKLDFFHPQTFVLNHQFPGGFLEPNETSITAVDFPIHDYIPAVIMKITGTHHPLVFRLYMLIYSMFGLFYLFKLAHLHINNIWASTLIVFIAATSPVFVYYQGNFLPTIPSLSNTIIGLYFFTNYLKNKKTSHFIIAILFMTLASLSRTPFAIFIIAIISLEFIEFIIKRCINWIKVIVYLSSVSIILGYYLYNRYLTSQYGSMFLNHIMLPDSINNGKEIIKTALGNWMYEYFTKAHYFVFAFIFLLSFFVAKKNYNTKFWRTSLFFTGVVLIGVIMYSILMLKQFPAHDYYFLDTFYLPSILFLILIVSKIDLSRKFNKTNKFSIFIILLFPSIFILNGVSKSQNRRYESGFWGRTAIISKALIDSESFLEEKHISKNSKILVLDATAPNLPFIYLNRKGYSILTTSAKNIEKSMGWDYDYIIVANEFLVSGIINNYPRFMNKVNKLGDNGKISIFERSIVEKDITLFEFLELKSSTPVFKDSVTFDTDISHLWSNISISDSIFYSGKYSGYMESYKDFGVTIKINELNKTKPLKNHLLVECKFYADSIPINNALVASLTKNGEIVLYKLYLIRDFIKHKKTWSKATLFIQLPNIDYEAVELAVYIWNRDKMDLYYDDFMISIY